LVHFGGLPQLPFGEIGRAVHHVIGGPMKQQAVTDFAV
jgi:hypothetical protein